MSDVFAHRLVVLLAMVTATACDVRSLRTQDLFGEPDAAAGQFCDPGTGVCAPGTGDGYLSGNVVSQCTGEPVDALVGIVEQHKCVNQGTKGLFIFTQLPVGVRLTLSSKAPGYALWTREVVIEPAGLGDVRITLVPQDGCPDPQAGPTCVCRPDGACGFF
jgi:hypothetical protein